MNLGSICLDNYEIEGTLRTLNRFALRTRFDCIMHYHQTWNGKKKVPFALDALMKLIVREVDLTLDVDIKKT